MKTRRLKLIRDAGVALTCAGVAKKQGRHIAQQDLSFIKKPAVLIEGERILWVGAQSRLPKELVKHIVSEESLSGQTLLPGFVDGHTHTVFAGSRAAEYELRNQGVSYQEITRRGGGIHSTVKKVRQASAQELQSLAEQRLARFLEQGVTCVEIKSGYGLDLAAELKSLKVAESLGTTRVVSTFLGAHALPKKWSSYGEYLNYLLQRVAPRVLRETNCRRADIFIEKGFFEVPEARRYLRALQQMGFELVIHADQLTSSGGTDLAVELGALSADHAIHLSESTLRKVAQSEVTLMLLPAADLYMKCPYPKARALIEAGGRVALATDFNPGSSPTQDLSLVGFLARNEMKMTLPEVFAAFTWNAARALNRHSDFGSLESGKMADFSAFEMDWDDFFYSIGGQKAQSVFIAGRKKLEQGSVLRSRKSVISLKK